MQVGRGRPCRVEGHALGAWGQSCWPEAACDVASSGLVLGSLKISVPSFFLKVLLGSLGGSVG